MEWIDRARLVIRKLVLTLDITLTYCVAMCIGLFLKMYFPRLHASFKNAVYAYAMKRASVHGKQLISGARPIASRDWHEIVRDGKHVVVSVKSFGEVEVTHLAAGTVFTVRGVPAEFCRMYATF